MEQGLQNIRDVGMVCVCGIWGGLYISEDYKYLKYGKKLEKKYLFEQ